MKDGKNVKGQFVKGRKMSNEEKEKIAQTMQGNSNAMKIKDDEILACAWHTYCNWIATGKGQRGFVYQYETEEGKKGSITWQTLERYAEKFPSICLPEQKEAAENIAYQAWENTGIDMMIGKIEKCQPAIYQMMMRNKFGWDKDTKVSHTYETDARKFFKFCENADKKTDETFDIQEGKPLC